MAHAPGKLAYWNVLKINVSQEGVVSTLYIIYTIKTQLMAD